MKKGKGWYIWLALALLLLCIVGGCSSTNEQTTQAKEQNQKSAPKVTSLKTEQTKSDKTVSQEPTNEQTTQPKEQNQKSAPKVTSLKTEQTEQPKPTQKDVKLSDEKGKVYATAHFPSTMEVQLKPVYIKIDDVHGQEIHVIQNGTDYEIGVVTAVNRSRDEYFADSLYSLLHQGNELSVYALYPTEIPPSVTALNNPNKTKEFVNIAQQVQQILKNMSY